MKTIGRKKPTRRPANWKGVERAVRGASSRFMRDVPEAEREALIASAMIEIRDVLRRLVLRAERATVNVRGMPTDNTRQLRREAIRACRAMGITPPPTGAPVDATSFRSRKRVLLRATHPDMTGTEATRDRYDAVMAACDAIETYNESLQSSMITNTVEGDSSDSNSPIAV